ncbi:DNA-directed RNA polymerase subunit omega [bacterium]|nr:DNA-directed RNA polymerase subunit omega [bacterium]
MDEFPLERLVSSVGSRFAVVVAAAQRAKQIKDGSPPLVTVNSRNPLTIALAEIAEGKVVIHASVDRPEELGITTSDQYYAGRDGEPEEPILFPREARQTRASVLAGEAVDVEEEEESDEEDEDGDEDE